MVEETTVTTNDLIYPLFLLDGSSQKVEVNSMPGYFQTVWRFDVERN